MLRSWKFRTEMPNKNKYIKQTSNLKMQPPWDNYYTFSILIRPLSVAGEITKAAS